MAKTLVDIESVSIGYSPGKSVWGRLLGAQPEIIAQDISLKLYAGQTVLLTGPNGAGKSTLAKSIAGFLPVLSGQLQTFGSVGYIPQQMNVNTLFPVRLWEVVEMSANFFWTRNKRKPAALEWLAQTGIDEKKAGLLFRNASGGQRQKALIARTLASRPSLIIADEPFANLDREGLTDIEQLFIQLTQNGTGLLIIDHHKLTGSLKVDASYQIRDGELVVL